MASVAPKLKPICIYSWPYLYSSCNASPTHFLLFWQSATSVRQSTTSVSQSVLVAQSFLTLCNPMDHMEPPARLLCPWDSPGKNTGVGCHFLLQGIFLTQGSNWGLLHCVQILYCLSRQASLKCYLSSFNSLVNFLIWSISQQLQLRINAFFWTDALLNGF